MQLVIGQIESSALERFVTQFRPATAHIVPVPLVMLQYYYGVRHDGQAGPGGRGAMRVQKGHEEAAAWGILAHNEPRWPASAAVLVALALYWFLPEKLTFGPNWLLPALELALLVPLSIAAPNRCQDEPPLAAPRHRRPHRDGQCGQRYLLGAAGA